MCMNAIMIALHGIAAVAASSLSKPCFDGVCFYDIPSTKDSMSGTVMITGPPSSISDITEVAGWVVLNCSSDTTTQDLRLVCASGANDCNHLYQGGAEGTVVRLPSNCGKGPFARVSRSWVSEDQDIPEHVARRLVKRDSVLPQVQALSLDPHFHKVDVEKSGAINVLVIGSTNPGAVKVPSLPPVPLERRSLGLHRRDLSNAVDLVIRSFKDATDDPDGTTFTENTTFPVSIDTSFNVFNQSIPCTSGDDTISVGFEAKADAQIMLGFVVAGTLAPPNITEAAFFANMTADLNGSLTLDAGLIGTFDTGRIGPLFSLPIPAASLSVPELITVGPSFNLFAEATLEIDIDVHLAVDLAYHVDNLQLVFPPSGGHPSSASATPQDSPLALSISPGIASNATITAHLIPSLNLGLTTFNDDVSATIFLDLDSSASLSLSLDADVTLSGSSKDTNDTQAQVNGCIGVNGGMSVNAGAEGSFFDLFDNTTQVALLSKDIQLFQKCFSDPKSGGPGSSNGGGSSSGSRKVPAVSIYSLLMQFLFVTLLSTLLTCVNAVPANVLEKRTGDLSAGSFSCPSPNIKPVASVINQVLSSSGFKEL